MAAGSTPHIDTPAEHGGTHLDAPIHFAEGRQTSDEIPLNKLIGPAAVIDVSERAHPDYLISIEDFTSWEAEHGQNPEGEIILARTGWGSRYDDRAAYLGTDMTGPDAVPEENIPGFENVANLDEFPPVGSYILALPMKIAGGSGGPLRIVGYMP